MEDNSNFKNSEDISKKKRVELIINRPIYSQEKRVDSSALKSGDRFLFKNHTSLLFKLNVKPNNNQQAGRL